MRFLMTFPILLVLMGCAGSPVGDALAGPEKLAAQDDGYCQSIGLKFGSNEYANCRLIQSEQRDRRHTARLGIAARGLSNLSVPTPSTTVTTTCSRWENQSTCTSH
jgi:hypothetical protein